MRRYLRLSAAVGLMLAAGALLALWARSCWRGDSIYVRAATQSFRVSSSESSLHTVVSVRGVSSATGEPWFYWQWRSREIKPALGPPASNKLNPLWLLRLQHARDVWYLNIPHWLVAGLLGAAGVALWRGSGRFTLRAMMTLTALIAVLLGIAARE
jgi:hypothetical protein